MEIGDSMHDVAKHKNILVTSSIMVLDSNQLRLKYRNCCIAHQNGLTNKKIFPKTQVIFL